MTGSPTDSPTDAAARALLAGLFAGAPADAAAALALALAAGWARDRALVVLPLGVQPATEARELAALHAAIALQSVRHGRPLAPTLMLSAGPVLRNGAAGAAADFLLALALSLDENPLIHACACGPGDPQPGAIIGPDTVRRAHAAGLQPGASLVQGQAAAFFAALGDTFAVAPPPAQVLRAILIGQD